MKSRTFNQGANEKTLKSSLTVLSLLYRTEEKENKNKKNFPPHHIEQKKKKTEILTIDLSVIDFFVNVILERKFSLLKWWRWVLIGNLVCFILLLWSCC